MKKMKIRKKVKNSQEVKTKKNINIKTTILSIILMGGITVVSLLLVFALYIIISSPDFNKEKLYSKESTVIYYADGTELTRIGKENRVLVNYDELPQVLIDAIVATEDSRFFQHKGLDVARFAKATFGQLLGKKDSGGASTLTMQIVKKTYTDETKTSGLSGIVRKFTDVYMSVFKVESNYTKEEIIEFYVNSMWFSGDGNINYNGIAGVEQACQYFFGKSVSDISLAEASIIAGMFQNPNLYNPFTKQEGLRARQTIVLKLMVLHGYITEEEKDAVLAIPIASLVRDRNLEEENSTNQAVIDYINSEVQQKTGLNPSRTPMKIYTTIQPDVQDVLNQLENGEIYEFPNEAMQEGIVITSTEDGSIVALSGGRNYVARGWNRSVKERQPGSTAKILFDYGPYLEYINGSSPGTMFLDEQTTYSNGSPIKNADGTYLGLISMRTALAKSRNIPALRAFKEVAKLDQTLIEDFVHSLGISYGDTLYESAAIGGGIYVTPLQMSAAYAAYGRGGYYIEPYVYTKIELIETGEIKEYKYEKEKVMSEETANMITDMLITAAKSGVGGVTVSGTQIAAKSGTSTIDQKVAQDKGIPTYATMDAWNITYSPEYSIALWIGYDETTKEHYLTTTIGGNVRLGVMKAIGSRIYSKNKTFDFGGSLTTEEIEVGTFPLQLASEYTPNDLKSNESFKVGTEPTDVSNRFAKLETPKNGNYSFSGQTLNLEWQGTIPEAADTTALQEYFNTYYEENATKYYEERINYNNAYIGSFGYNIYQKDESDNLTYIGRTNNTNFTINNVTNSTTYVIKSAYSIFTANISDGLEIKVQAVDNNVGGMIGNNSNQTNQGNNNDNSENELD